MSFTIDTNKTRSPSDDLEAAAKVRTPVLFVAGQNRNGTKLR